MNIKTHQTAVVIIPPENIWQPIQKIRQHHDRHFRRWMPHITMIYPFRPRKDFDELTEQFYPACKHIQPFQIRCSLINQFQHPGENFTLLLAPEPKEPIIDLQNALLNLVPDCDDVTKFKNGFTPHLSIRQVKGKSAMLKLKDALQASWTPLVFEINEISFIWRNEPPDDVFQLAENGHGIEILMIFFPCNFYHAKSRCAGAHFRDQKSFFSLVKKMTVYRLITQFPIYQITYLPNYHITQSPNSPRN